MKQERKRNPSRQEGKRFKKVCVAGGVTKMAGLYSEGHLGKGQPCPWAREFRIEGKVCQPYRL